jgi:hypothetical protein
MGNTNGKYPYPRTIDMPEEWRDRISQAVQQLDPPTTEAAWFREAVAEKLERDQNAKELRKMEERMAATLGRVVDTLDHLQRAVQSIQAQLTLQDTINKQTLSYLPEPADAQTAREIGQARYAKAVQFTSGHEPQPQTRSVRRDVHYRAPDMSATTKTTEP